MKGINKLKEAVLNDCKNGDNCFNDNGCDKNKSKCFHKYCDTYKWIIDRAMHYAKKLDIEYLEVLDQWEERRTYWYMNYYQEAQQPLLDSENIVMLNEWRSELKKRFGDDPKNWKFVCPACGHIQSCGDFEDEGYQRENAYYNCIGRFKKGVGCTWTIGGLLNIHKTTVIKKCTAYPVFEMA